ncbi:MAG: peptide-methionine (R)-S-oxide reductase MsrB [Pseudomonadales bacterium]|nr:peptide-methionine (R)-S-oxide reductase MsrB [Pseudomonadales bacterium]
MSQAPIKKTDAQWREQLSDFEYYVLREKGTERPFTGEFNDFKGSADFACRGCGQPLFSSAAKYDSGSGWPSFFEAVNPEAIREYRDSSLGMERVEIVCSRCDSHLGHVFTDGPRPTGLRYCVNSVSLTLDSSKSAV